MPAKTSNQKSAEFDPTIVQFRKLIELGEIGAISIDTTVFDDNGKQFEKGIFGQLRQFGTHPQKLIISEVVLKEIYKHFHERVEKSRARFDRDMYEVCAFVGGPTELIGLVQSYLEKMPPVDELCDDQFSRFLKESNAIILPADDYIKVSNIIEMYFQESPPFHVENPKKKEFPDAISLASLQSWAERNKTGVIVVSRDKDWEAYCKNSTRLHVVKTLPDALSIFQTPDEIVEGMLARLRRELQDVNSHISSIVQETLADYDWSDNVSTTAYSSFEFDEEVDFEIQDMTLHDARENTVKITEIDGKTVSFSFNYDIKGIVDLYCSFRKWDGIDREYVRMGSERFRREFENSVSFLLTMPVSQGDFFDITVEVQPEYVHIDFDEVEPDFGRIYDRE